MIVGSGLIASIFKNEFEDDRDIVVFASGVSNSIEITHSRYQREWSLLQSFEKTEAKLVYFSTVSIFDPTLQDSPYIRHKLEIEEYISSHFQNYIIFRLPIVVGHSKNLNTLTNFLFERIQKEEEFFLYQKAWRYILDADDVGKFLFPLIRDSTVNHQSLNIHFEKAISIFELVKMLEVIAGRKAVFKIINKGSFYDTDNRFFLTYLSSCNFVPAESYVFDVLKKYYF